MTTFLLIPGAGGAGEIYWREVVAGLTGRGHTAVAVEIRGDDPALGLPEYAAITDAAITDAAITDAAVGDAAVGDDRDVVLVAQSMGGFTVPMIASLDRVSRIVLVNAMVPLPGETPGQWFEATGQQAAFEAAAVAAGRGTEFDEDEVFLHDVPAELLPGMREGDRGPADTPFAQPCTFTAWPAVPTLVLVGADDRLFPADFQARIARERLGIEAEVIPGGHLVAKSRPRDVVERLLAFANPPVPFTLDDAAAALRRVAADVPDDRLDAPTPCADWKVRDLLAHLVMLTAAFTRTARHEAAGPPPAGAELPADWRDRLGTHLEELVAAWKQPSAWQGESEAGGVTMPAAGLAVVVLDELVLHTWDLARATGRPFVATPHDVARCTEFAAAMSTPDALAGRAGLYGPVVPTAAAADPFDVLLGLAGREPAWSTPSG